MLGPPGFENGCRHKRFLSESHDNFYLNVWPSPRATARKVAMRRLSEESFAMASRHSPNLEELKTRYVACCRRQSRRSHAAGEK
jgi:hypothetical protein